MKISLLQQNYNYLNNSGYDIAVKKNNGVSFAGKEKNIIPLSAAIGTTLAGYAGINIVTNDLSNDSIIKKCIESKNSNDFEKYKKYVIKFFSKNDYYKYDRKDENIIENLENADDINDLNFELEVFLSRIQDKYEQDMQEILEHCKDSKNKNELYNQKEIEIGNVIVSVLKLMQVPSTDKEVLKIQKELEQKYGLKSLYLDNDIIFAKALKNVLSILDKNNIPISQVDSVFAADCVDFGGVCLNTDNGKTVVIDPNSWQIDDLEYTMLHEFIHTLQPDSIDFQMQPIPEEFKETADNVSDYARDNFAHEVHCELFVKKLLKSLNPEEEKLFNYLGGTFIKE